MTRIYITPECNLANGFQLSFKRQHTEIPSHNHQPHFHQQQQCRPISELWAPTDNYNTSRLELQFDFLGPFRRPIHMFVNSTLFWLATILDPTNSHLTQARDGSNSVEHILVELQRRLSSNFSIRSALGGSGWMVFYSPQICVKGDGESCLKSVEFPLQVIWRSTTCVLQKST